MLLRCHQPRAFGASLSQGLRAVSQQQLLPAFPKAKPSTLPCSDSSVSHGCLLLLCHIAAPEPHIRAVTPFHGDAAGGSQPPGQATHRVRPTYRELPPELSHLSGSMMREKNIFMQRTDCSVPATEMSCTRRGELPKKCSVLHFPVAHTHLWCSPAASCPPCLLAGGSCLYLFVCCFANIAAYCALELCHGAWGLGAASLAVGCVLRFPYSHPPQLCSGQV